MRPSWISLPTTKLAVLTAMAKQIPCAGRIIAVLTPMTRPCASTSGPPELPGFSAASVWMTSSTSRPDCVRSERPSALTTPAVTVQSKPNGLPTATAIWPTRSADESPNATGVRSGACSRTTARSVSGSSPTRWPGSLRPSSSVTRDALGAADDVAVGQHVAVGREHEARTAADRLVRARAGGPDAAAPSRPRRRCGRPTG